MPPTRRSTREEPKSRSERQAAGADRQVAADADRQVAADADRQVAAGADWQAAAGADRQASSRSARKNPSTNATARQLPPRENTMSSSDGQAVAVANPKAARKAPSTNGDGRTERFGGFPDEAIQFLLDLQAEQSRTWFKAHQDDYVRFCRKPLELLVTELQERLTDVYPYIGTVEPHIFRIQRDTRFAKDKAPYKTNLAASIPLRPPEEGGDRHTTPGIYLSFGLDGEWIALGAWHMHGADLARYRELLVKPRVGTQLMSIVNGLLEQGWQLGSMEALKRVPAPYPQDHPCAELLKRKGLAASVQPREGVSATAAYADWAEARLRDAAPMIQWLDRHLG